MAFKYADRVKDTTTSTGTGDATLAGSPPTGYQSFNAGIGVGPQFAYCIFAGSEWEVGLTVLSGSTTLVRNGSQIVLASSNSGSAVSFSAGTKTVICTIPAARQPFGGTIYAHSAVGGINVPSSATRYTPVLGGNQSGMDATEANTQGLMSRPGTLRNLYIKTSSTQPSSGSLVFTMRVNGSDTGVVLTIAANTVAGTYSNTTNTADVVAGDLVSMKAQNNATSGSAIITHLSYSVD